MLIQIRYLLEIHIYLITVNLSNNVSVVVAGSST